MYCIFTFCLCVCTHIHAHVHACMHVCVHVHGSRDVCMPWHMSRGQRKFSRVNPGLLPCLRPGVSFATVHTTLPGPHVFQESSCLPLHRASEALRLLVCTTMLDLTWVLRSRTQVLEPVWQVLYPPSHLPNLRTFFLNNIVLGVVPLCRFHCAQPSPGSLTNASFPCHLNTGNAVNNLRVPEASVLGPSINTGLHGHAGPCTNDLTLARNACTSSCTLSVSFALLRTTSTSQVCVNSC